MFPILKPNCTTAIYDDRNKKWTQTKQKIMCEYEYEVWVGRANKTASPPWLIRFKAQYNTPTSPSKKWQQMMIWFDGDLTTIYANAWLKYLQRHSFQSSRALSCRRLKLFTMGPTIWWSLIFLRSTFFGRTRNFLFANPFFELTDLRWDIYFVHFSASISEWRDFSINLASLQVTVKRLSMLL